MATVVQRDPLPKRRGPRTSKWPNIVTELHEIAPEWGFIGEFSPGVATQIKNGLYPAFIPTGFTGDRKKYMDDHYEVTITTITGTRRCELFIRELEVEERGEPQG